MKKMRTRLAAMLMAGAMATTMFGVNVFADTQSLSTSNSMTVGKVVTTDGKTLAPNTTFTYTVAASTDTTAYDGNVVYAGVANALSKTSGTFTFTPGTTVAAEYKAEDSISFDASQFSKAGVYHYTISETTGSYAGITYDTSVYDLYVYVQNKSDNTGLEIQAIVSAKDVTSDDGTKTKTKTNLEFSNDYGANNDTTHDVTLKKVITGNQSNTTDVFSFTVSVTADQPGESFYVEYTQKNGTAATTIITTDSTRTGSVVLNDISNNDTIKINGLTSGDTYSITENENTNGYTVTYTGKNTGNATEDGVTATATNTKQITTPTGIILNYGPYAAIVVLAGALAVVFLRRRNREEI